MLSGFKFSRIKSGMFGLDLSVMNEESHQNLEANIVNRSWLEDIVTHGLELCHPIMMISQVIDI